MRHPSSRLVRLSYWAGAYGVASSGLLLVLGLMDQNGSGVDGLLVPTAAAMFGLVQAMAYLVLVIVPFYVTSEYPSNRVTARLLSKLVSVATFIPFVWRISVTDSKVEVALAAGAMILLWVLAGRRHQRPREDSAEFPRRD